MEGRAEPRLSGGFNRTLTVIVLVAAVFLGLFWVAQIQDMRKTEREAREQAFQNAQFSADAASEAVSALLDRLRVSLRISATAALQSPEALSLYGEVVSAGADELVFQLFFIGADGYLAYTSLGKAPRNHLADRDYFRTLAAPDGPDFVVSAPMLGRLTSKWSIQVAHAVRRGNRFGGVVAMAISPDRWVEHLSRFQAGPRDVVTLFSPDGTLLLRSRDGDNTMGRKLTADRPFLRPDSGQTGTYEENDSFDGIRRAYAWRRLPTGHVLVAGVTLADALAPVQVLNQQSLWRGGAATVLLAVALGFVAFFVRRANRAAREIAEQEYLQRVTLSVLAEGLAIVNPSGEITFHNDSFRRLIPYSGDRLLRHGSVERWNVIDTSGRSLPLDEFPSVITARTGKPFDNLTLGVGQVDGAIRWLNINTRPLNSHDGSIHGAILTLTDITSQREAEQALKLSEERYRTVVDALTEGIMVHSADGTPLSVNPAAERILGVERRQLMGRNLANAAWGATRADSTPLMAEDHPALITLHTGQRQLGVMLSLMRPDGTVAWVEVSTAPLWGATPNQPVAVLTSLLDITNRKSFEDDLSRSNAELEQFAYAVSHDLREPLRMVASYVQLLQRRMGDSLGDDIKEFIAFAVDGAKRMDRMLVALLEYSRVGRMGQPMEWIDSRQSLEEALMFLSPAIQQTGAELTVTGDWPEIFASPDEIERLFQNLVGNALKYHPENAVPALAIHAGADPLGWRFSFTDNGIGIAPDQIGRLFKVFQRLHANDRYEGSGVGLALCRKIVQRHEGRIWVESIGLGKGSTFIFTLPLSMTRPPGQLVSEDVSATP